MSLLHSAVLVLNQSYEPLSICSARRALLLVLRERAQIVERLEGVIRSVSQHYAVPSVVRLYKYVNVPRRNIVLSKSNVLKRDRYFCQYCGNKTNDLTVDHIVPRSKGGPSSWENLVCACFECNNKKGDNLLSQIGMELRSKPLRPSSFSFIRNIKDRRQHQWRPYLLLD
jgi:5-methylcytosine-specific restriction endonuclease McrA